MEADCLVSRTGTVNGSRLSGKQNWHLTVTPELAKTRGIQLSKGEGAQSAYRMGSLTGAVHQQMSPGNRV